MTPEFITMIGKETIWVVYDGGGSDTRKRHDR